MDFARTDCQTNNSDNTRIIINVGGFRHETNVATLQNIPDTRLAWIVENSSTSDVASGPREYFFDRHPTAFAQVLNFYRTGKLHCPTEMCGPMYEEELKFWGVDEKQMEPCCWGKYTQHREAEENLRAFVGPGFEDLRCTDKVIFASGIGSEESLNGKSTRWQKWQPKMWAILEEPHSSRLAKVVSYMSCFFITISIAIFCATTMPSIRLKSKYGHKVMGRQEGLNHVEMICSVFFAIEFILRLIFCPSKLRFIRGIMNWIDFIAVVPYFLSLITEDQIIRMLVVIRILRLFRFIKLSYGLQIMVQTLKASSHELILLLLMLLIPVVMFSSIVYYIEFMMIGDDSKFSSVPASFWWCLITMTTVGYGDIAPETWPGKLIGGACAICGVLIVALPISVIGSNFNLYYSHAQARLKLPMKQRRLVLGAVPGLLSKQQELSSRRKKKNKLSGVDYELCTSDELSSSMNSLQLQQMQQRRSRPGLKVDEIPLNKDHEESRQFPQPRSRGRLRESLAMSQEDIFSPEDEKENLLREKIKFSKEDWDDGFRASSLDLPLNVTVSPTDQDNDSCHGNVPSSNTLDISPSKPSLENKRDDVYLNPLNGLPGNRKLSLSDSKLCTLHTRNSMDESPSNGSLSKPLKDPNKYSITNGDCNSTTNDKDAKSRPRTSTISSLPDYSGTRRKGISVAQSTSKGDPDFMETKI